MAKVKANLDLSRDIEARASARRDARLASLDPSASSAGITRGYHQDLVWPRSDLAAAKAAIIEAVRAGHSDTRLLQQYAVALTAVERGQAKHAFMSLLHDGVLQFGASLMQTLPGPLFPTLEPSLP
jgi:hypothetical protein